MSAELVKGNWTGNDGPLPNPPPPPSTDANATTRGDVEVLYPCPVGDCGRDAAASAVVLTVMVTLLRRRYDILDHPTRDAAVGLPPLALTVDSTDIACPTTHTGCNCSIMAAWMSMVGASRGGSGGGGTSTGAGLVPRSNPTCSPAWVSPASPGVVNGECVIS